jgi:hypothetical protein
MAVPGSRNLFQRPAQIRQTDSGLLAKAAGWCVRRSGSKRRAGRPPPSSRTGGPTACGAVPHRVGQTGDTRWAAAPEEVTDCFPGFTALQGKGANDPPARPVCYFAQGLRHSWPRSPPQGHPALTTRPFGPLTGK